MVDIKSLLTKAAYKDLALLILGNRDLMVQTIARVSGAWLLQSGQLSGVSKAIKNFLNYDELNLSAGFGFDVRDGKAVVKPY